MLDFIRNRISHVSDVPSFTHPPRPHQHGGGHAPKRYGSDFVGITGFAESGFVIARAAPPHAPWIQQRVSTLHERATGAATNLTDGIRKSLEVLKFAPKGALRRMWLLTDGMPNREIDSLWQVVAEARAAYVNINTIGFGEASNYDESLLRRIASSTHNGQFVSATSLRELAAALVRGPASGPRPHRSETCIYCIDLSASMREPMDGKTKIQCVEDALIQLLLYKQRLWS